MTSFDFLVIAVVAFSVIFAVIRGALREIGTLAVLAAAAAAALFLMKPLQSALGAGESFMTTVAIAGAVGAVGFVGFYCLLHLGLKRVALSARAARIDRIAGGVFGLARGLVLVGLGFLAYAYYLDIDQRPESVNNAATLPIAEAMANFFEGLAPEGARLTPGAKPKVEEPATNAAVEGYGRTERSALAEIVTTVTTRDDPTAEINDTDRKPAGDPIAEILKESEPE